MTAFDPRILPADLPVPEDDGAADHLPGLELPALSLPSTAGPVDLRGAAAGTLVLYIYPRTGRPGEPPPDGWDATPGARGCTPQSCAFRDHRAELAAWRRTVVGMSAQTLADQVEFAAREHIPYPLIADPDLQLGGARSICRRSRSPGCASTAGSRSSPGPARIEHVFYPVFPPDRNAADVVAWLSRARPAAP